MDPKATLQRLCDAIWDDDSYEIAESAKHLHGWLNIGGFEPQVNREQLRALLWALIHAEYDEE